MKSQYCVIVVGAGASGFFAALNAKQMHPHAKVAIIEKNAAILSKVKVSGGGRCNTTHACFEPKQLVKNYPRGQRELLGPFYVFQPQDTIDWFEARGVNLKTESDGRMFPTTDKSETIINCLVDEAKKIGVELLTKQKIVSINKNDSGFDLVIKEKGNIYCDKLILATGSAQDGYKWARELGHSIITPLPSLFTFNVPKSPLADLSGVAFENVTVSIKGSSYKQTGPLLITHFGFSGPAVLKLSAWAARLLHEKKYSFDVVINWLPHQSQGATVEQLSTLKRDAANKNLISENVFKLPKSFWKKILTYYEIDEKRLNDLTSKDLNRLAEKLHTDVYQVSGKTTNKEEFVTCGGVALKEVDFKAMESKLCPNLFFCGEILDIDGITGGFNFQNAWTTGYIAGTSIELK